MGRGEKGREKVRDEGGGEERRNTYSIVLIRCDTIDKLKDKLPQLRAEYQDESHFKDFYMFIFEYGKQEGQKSLALDVAIELWQLVLSHRFKFLELWANYLKVHILLFLSLSLSSLFSLPLSSPVPLLFLIYVG